MIKKCAVIILIALLSFVRVSFVQADSGRMYELDNMITNGDFSIDSNSDGLGNDWVKNKVGTTQIISGIKRAYSDATAYYFGIYQQNLSLIAGNKYYVTMNFTSNKKSTYRYYVMFGTPNTIEYQSLENVVNFVFTADYNYTVIYMYVVDTTSTIIPNTYYIDVSNVMVFDLSSLFGFGNEPSLSDFEMYYLPDLDYFEYYNSFDPTSYVQLVSSDYTNITTDLTGIDYSKSIIARNGDNINIDFYAYFYDSSDNTGSGLAWHYYNYNHPKMFYLGSEHELSWEYSDYSDRVMYLYMTDEQKDIFKTILFNRVVDPDNEYFEFRIDAYYWDYVKIYVVMTSTFDLLVDVKSFMISRKTYTDNDFVIVNEMNVKTYDQKGDLYLPVIKLNLGGDILETRVIDGFGSGYTRISRFNFEFEFTSPENDDPYAYELQYLYELGIFSSDDVLIPPDVDIPIDLDGLFPYQVCDAFQIGCHLKNSLNDVVLWLWDVLDVQAIYATFAGIVQSVDDVIDLLPSWVNDIMLVLAGALAVGFVIIIFDRSSKGGES